MNQETAANASTSTVVPSSDNPYFRILSDIARELAGSVVFPTSFDAALRLRKELQNPDLPTAKIASIVSLEPLIATRIMQLAGSTLYSPDGTPPRNLQAAINRLGVELVRTTALSIAMNQMMRSRSLESFTELAGVLWQHSIRTAAAARILARAQTRINPDEALLAGLVHDLGAFYMLYRAAQYPELRGDQKAVKALIIEWHENIGVTLLNALGLPEGVVDASTDHDQLRHAPLVLRTLNDVIYAASLLDDAHFHWMHEGKPSTEADMLRESFAEFRPDIDADVAAMQSVFA